MAWSSRCIHRVILRDLRDDALPCPARRTAAVQKYQGRAVRSHAPKSYTTRPLSSSAVLRPAPRGSRATRCTQLRVAARSGRPGGPPPDENSIRQWAQSMFGIANTFGTGSWENAAHDYDDGWHHPGGAKQGYA